MGFIQNCIIHKINQDLINKLESLGYLDIWSGGIHTDELKTMTITYANKGCWSLTGFNPADPILTKNPTNHIDCGSNEDLFLALAALRDDSDKHQWFTDGNLWEKSEDDLPSRYMQLNGHKADVNEIIQHFS